MKKFILIAMSMMFAFSCANNAPKQDGAEAEQARLDSIAAASKAVINVLDSLPDEPLFDIETNMGRIRVKLYGKTPKHRDNFARLVLTGYYNGVLFHRVISDFMIQGGDPLSKDPELKSKWGTGGPEYKIPAEFVPEYRHKKGALAAARQGDAANPLRESSGSQFYIVQSEDGCRHLDGQYSVFGETVEGFDVIDNIAAVPTDPYSRPIKDVKIISIKLVE